MFVLQPLSMIPLTNHLLEILFFRRSGAAFRQRSTTAGVTFQHTCVRRCALADHMFCMTREGRSLIRIQFLS